MVDFRDTGAEAAFRTEVRGFIGDEYEPRRTQMRSEARQAAPFERTPAMRTWEGELAERGWIAPAWPKQYGGAGLSVMQQFIFNEEMAEARAPRPGGIAIGMAGPTLITIGTEEQRAEHLPPILSGEAIWCQGYSEPGRRLGPGLAADPRRQGRRRLGRQRAEDLDIGGRTKRIG